jgi:tetratricopeptide (TPR) repeat protein
MCREYNDPMHANFCRSVGWLIPCVLASTLLAGQNSATKAAAASDPGRATVLAENGHCTEALPLLKRAIRQTSDREMKKRLGLDGVHCAMVLNTPYDSLEFLSVLTREFPRDPDVLYAATHAFSDLSMRTSQDLAREAPFSFQVHELNAEALEIQGRWDDAAAEYRKILDINPMLPGVHARLGRTYLSRPQPTAEDAAKAKKAFEEELEIDPRNAAAEYVLGQLAADSGDSASAIQHFTKASKLDVNFSEAFLGLGTSLNSAKRYADAIPPLETYEKMAPDSPTGHYQLAVAYSGAGRKADANREAQLQRQASEALEAVKRKAAIAQEKQTSSESQPEQK